MIQRKWVGMIFMVFFISFFYCFSAGAENLEGDNYIIGPGDELDISVWRNTELSKVVPVLPDGSISFPLVGRMQVDGKTLSQFQDNLTEKLVKYIPNPSLFVVVKKVNIQIYVIGKVKKPGMFKLNSNIDVLQSLTLAGGLNRFADRDEIIIMRKVGDSIEKYEFEYDEVSAGNKLEQNIILHRGDVVVVP